MFQEDLNTSTSWDLIDPDCDTEVPGITKGKTQPQVDQTVNANTDSAQAKPELRHPVQPGFLCCRHNR